MLNDRKSYIHTHNPACRKIPEAADLHTRHQCFADHICELIGYTTKRVPFLRDTAGLADLMILSQMITGVRCSAINWLDLAAIATLPTLLRVLASKKTKPTSVAPYPGRFRTCTLSGCTNDL